MQIGGFQPTSLVDYPGTISAIVFTVGCNFRCPYCHNPELVFESPERFIPEEEVFAFLEKRKGKLPAVTVTGGEPTMQEDLLPFFSRLKEMGYLVKLDTNGTNPRMLQEAVEQKRVDYVAMDIKAPLAKYAQVTCSAVNADAIRKSTAFLLQGRVPYEFRTTVAKGLLSPEDLRIIGKEIAGAQQYFLQQFSPAQTLHPAFRTALSYTDEELRAFARELEAFVTNCNVRSQH